jgi:hypothetical protein
MCPPLLAGLGAAGAGTAAAGAAAASTAGAATGFLGMSQATLTGLQMAASVGGLFAQMQQQQAQEAANRQQYENSMQAWRQNQAYANLEKVTETANYAEQKLVNDSAMRRAMATAKVSSGEAGVAGLSVDALLADIGAKAGRDNTVALVNRDRRNVAIDANSANNYATMASQINSLQTPKQPDYLGAALKIGTADYEYTKATGRSFFS